jgi:SAM-dependent methyltransferase
MDARDLSSFGPGEFAAVVFSLNGIDGLSHSDRARTFSEVHRVLRPGGWFAYSTLNLAFRLAGARWRPDPRRTIRHPTQSVRTARQMARSWWNRRRYRDLTESGEGWASIVSRAYERPVIWHNVTYPEALRELRSARLDAETEVYTSDGTDALKKLRGTATALPLPESPELHVLARRA